MTTKKSLASKFRRTLRIRDKATELYYDEIEFPVSSEEVARIILPPSVVNDPSTLESKLRDAGAIFPKDSSV